MYQIQKWLTSLDMQFPVVQPARDLANGMSVAEIISHYRPEVLVPAQLYDAKSMLKRKSNWDFITRKLHVISFTFPPTYDQQIDDIINQRLTASGEDFLGALLEFFTGEKILKVMYRQESKLARKTRPTKQLIAQTNHSEQTLKTKLLQQKQYQSYQDSFTAKNPSVLDILKQSYLQTAQQIKLMTMYDVFLQLAQQDEAFEEVDDDLQNQQTVQTYPDEPQSLFAFFESAVQMSNIDLNSPNEMICRIFFHFRFLWNIEQNMDSIILACGRSLQKEFSIIIKMINTYYNAQNDLIYIKQKDLTHNFMDLLLQNLEDNNPKKSQYLQILLHQIFIALPQEFGFVSEQFVMKNVVLERPMMSHVLADQFYNRQFYFLKQRTDTQTVRYMIKSQNTMTQTSFICTLLSKILIKHPKPVIQMINSYVLQQMKVSNNHLLNTASKEYTELLGGDDTDFQVQIVETQQDLKPMNRLQLLFMMLLAEQFTFTFEYSKQINLNIIQICKFFMFYALQIDVLKTDNTRSEPLIFNYLERRKSMVVMYMNIVAQLYLLISLDSQKVIDSQDKTLIQTYIKEFAQKQNSKLTVIFRGVQIITNYIIGSNMNKQKVKEAQQKEKLETAVKNFVMSERSDNLQAVITATAQMCEHLYGTIMGFVDMCVHLYENVYNIDVIHKYLQQLPGQSVQLDETFITIFNIIQQLNSVCNELLEILEAIHTASAGLRKESAYQLIDMDLEEEPLYPCMAELHRHLKRLF
ncbi:Conserved_hypothetical protein [Hexamita inflata]|uniref:CH-like domain-containing protein n=1 Tax=Hexamita inflata TaxID=28002 RepID=A0AA86PWF8_9EUKA|nr:Conserved hypothetical protein [Hexamita inflata]